MQIQIVVTCESLYKIFVLGGMVPLIQTRLISIVSKPIKILVVVVVFVDFCSKMLVPKNVWSKKI